VILPPNWNAAAPTGSYPIVFQAFYDVNENLFLGFGQAQAIATWIAESGTGGRTGAIGVSNPTLSVKSRSFPFNNLAGHVGS